MYISIVWISELKKKCLEGIINEKYDTFLIIITREENTKHFFFENLSIEFLKKILYKIEKSSNEKEWIRAYILPALLF